VFSSTGGAIYGECETPATEAWERRPLSPYGTSKLSGEEYLAAWNRLHGTRHVALRYGNVYGPRQDPHGEAGVVAIFLRAVSDGRRPTIFGDGSQERDYVYVGDVARATLAATKLDGGVINIATGVPTSVLQLVDAMRRATGRGIDPEHGPLRLGDLQRSVLDASLAERELGWRPEVSLEDGLRETWQFFSG
jgi:UDP-glucose 4-epimerase